MGLGEKSPAKAIHLTHPDKIICREQLLKPSFFTPDHIETGLNGHRFELMYYFKVLESPIVNILQTSLKFTRPKTVINEHIQMIEQMFNSKLVWALMIISIGINLLRLFLLSATKDLGYYYLLLGYFQILSVLPVLPISVPFLLVITKSFGNAYILTLFEALQSSKTEFEDNDDVDEFDLAPAPTKDLSLSISSILQKFIIQMVRFDGSSVARMTGLIEVLLN
jgi:hypothetical protein